MCFHRCSGTIMAAFVSELLGILSKKPYSFFRHFLLDSTTGS